MYRRSAQGWSKHLDFILIDLVSLQLAYIIASYVRHGSFPYFTLIYRNLGIALVLIDLVVLMFLNTMHDVLRRGHYVELSKTIKHCIIVLALATTYMFGFQTGGSYSRILLFVTFIFYVVYAR